MHKMIILGFMIGIGLAGCASESTVPPVTVVSVPSSKPYRYIHYSKTDDPKTIAEVRHHNYVHSLVKKAEADATKAAQ